MSDKDAVLVVDDDPTTVMLMKHYLEGLGVTVIVANDGESALEILQAQSALIGLVFLDLAMPYMSGYQLCKAIRADTALASLPVIAVTARSGPDLPAEARQAGIDQVIAKPFKPTILREILAQYSLITSQ